MTRSLGGEQSLKAEVFAASDGSQLGHCTIKGRNAATQVYGMLSFVWGGVEIEDRERERSSISYTNQKSGQRTFVYKDGTGNAFGFHWQCLRNPAS